MKKIIILLLCCGVLLLFSACDIGDTGPQSEEDNPASSGLSVPDKASAPADHSAVVSPDASDTVGLPSDAQEAPNTDTSINDVMDGLRAKIDLSGKLSFSAKTPFGDDIDSAIFAEYDLTMINIWGTLCKPCIEEMPDIQKLYMDMQSQGVNVIGFIANYQDDRVEKAKEILTAKGVTYSNVVFDDEISGAIYGQVPGFPTTIFLDSKGNVVGDQVAGAHSSDEYKAIIKDILEACRP